MSNYSCTNQRYDFAPLRIEEINILPVGTLLFRAIKQVKSGDPTIFSDTMEIFPSGTTLEAYLVVKDLPYIIGLPEDKGAEGLCWEYREDENFCYDDNLNVELPQPMVWSQEPYFYICNFDNLQYLDTRLI